MIFPFSDVEILVHGLVAMRSLFKKATTIRDREVPKKVLDKEGKPQTVYEMQKDNGNDITSYLTVRRGIFGEFLVKNCIFSIFS